MNQVSKSLKADLKSITDCYRLCFKDSLSVKLGFDYSQKNIEWFLGGENRFLLHAADNENKIIGYAGGFISRYNGDGSSSGMLQYAMAEAFKGIALHPWLLLNKELLKFYPLILKNIARKLFPKKNTNAKIFKTEKDQTVGLVAIGIHPAFRGTGVFEILMKAFEEEAAKRKITKIGLSVKKSNVRAINAYKKIGYTVFREHSQSYEMIKIIGP